MLTKATQDRIQCICVACHTVNVDVSTTSYESIEKALFDCILACLNTLKEVASCVEATI